VLELMREAQMQHGLRQSDYTRYRCVMTGAVHPILLHLSQICALISLDSMRVDRLRPLIYLLLCYDLR